jgi:hypothetical protein
VHTKLFLSTIVGLILLSSCFVVSGEDTGASWSQTYGGERDEQAFSVVVTSDGGFAMAGYKSIPIGHALDQISKSYSLVKTDEFGNMTWSKTWTALGREGVRSFVEVSDGGYGLVGIASGECYFVKADEFGNWEWTQIFGGKDYRDEQTESVIVTLDGGFAIAGQLYADFWLVKTDTSGDVEWGQTYGGTADEVAYSLVGTSDRGYALAGFTNSSGSGNKDFWLVKTDEYGNMEWNRTYGGTGWEEATSLIQTSDNGYAIAGYTNSSGDGGYDFWLVKTDEFGNMEWNQTYGGTSSDVAYSLVATSDGGYAIAGETWSFGAGSGDFWLVKTDDFGNMKWDKTYGGELAECAYSMVATSDGGYALVGYTASFGAGGTDFWLVKTDAQGNVLGLESVQTPINIPPILAVIGGGLAVTLLIYLLVRRHKRKM